MRRLLVSFPLLASVALAGSAQAAPPLYRITDLGDLPGGTDSSEAHAINDAGTIVGESSSTQGTHAFLWQDGVLYDLNDLIDPSDPLAATTELAQAFDINASGQIVGRATIGGFSHAFLLTPVAIVPTSDAPILGFVGLLLALLAVGLLWLPRGQRTGT